MKTAWIGKHEIIPYDSIEAVELEENEVSVYLGSHERTIQILGKDNVNHFRIEYTMYLETLSKAISMLGADE